MSKSSNFFEKGGRFEEQGTSHEKMVTEDNQCCKKLSPAGNLQGNVESKGFGGIKDYTCNECGKSFSHRIC